MSIRTLSSREIYRNPWLRLREDQIERSNGARGIYGVVEKDDCALIIPVEGDRIYLIEQFRYTIQQRALELPQGGWETADVDPEELARGELREETGLTAATMMLLGTMWIAYGFARQRQFVYLATGLTPAGNDPDPEEHDLVLKTTTIAEFERDVPPNSHPFITGDSRLMTRPGKLSRRRLESSACVVRLAPELPACFELM
jgi:8-oxo-dGTP pyrophosphatase MutT (NUDIX family)